MKATLIRCSNEVTTCDCCGKSKLIYTAVIRFTKKRVAYYGSDCAEKALGFSVDSRREWFKGKQ